MSKTAELQEQIKTARAAMADLVKQNDEIADAAEGSDENGTLVITIEPGMRETFKSNLAQIKDMNEVIELAEAQLAGKQFLDAPAPNGSVGMRVASATQHQVAKSIGQMFVESDEFKALGGGANGLTMRTPWNSGLGDISRYARKAAGDVFSDMPTGTPGTFGRVERADMVGRPHRTIRVRDLFTVVPTDAKVIEYFEITGFTNAASGVAERDGADGFVAKPQSSLTVEGAQAVARTIAHWVAAHRDTLSDEPQLQNIIDTELLYGLQLREDQQILFGAGTSQDLLGIMNHSRTQSQAQGSNTNADAIRKAITKVQLAEYEATGVVLHPSNWETIEIEREASNGQYINAIVSNVATGAEPRLWRLPLVVTQAMTATNGLVGAFGIGATLYERADATIRIAEQHDDFFIKNAVVVLAEERIALTIQRPESFCKITGLD